MSGMSSGEDGDSLNLAGQWPYQNDSRHWQKLTDLLEPEVRVAFGDGFADGIGLNDPDLAPDLVFDAKLPQHISLDINSTRAV